MPTASGDRIASVAKPAAPTARRHVAVGLASWYGARFHGRRTANGETFDMLSLTAAHPSMPLPSYARVTNVSNGRSIVVRVNDRGPFTRGRLIDVSSRAADLLGFRSLGVGNVKVDYVGPAGPQGSDDRKLVATYREFGRPAAPAGVRMAGLASVADADLAGGATVASAAPSPAAVGATAGAGTAIQVGLRTPPVVAYAPQPAGPVAVALGEPVKPASRPAAQEAASKPAAAAKRVVQPVEPVLASAAPAITATEPAPTPSAKPDPAVAARIAASFEGFGVFSAPAPAFTGLR